jgi:exodeoxyribonuclease-3
MKIATWNINSLAVRLPQVQAWLGEHQPDVLCLQETKLTDDKFPADAWAELGYQVAFFGQKTYNGVALLSRTPIESVVKNIPGFEDAQARVITATVRGVRVVGAYFPNGQAPDSEKFVYKMQWLQALRTWIAQELQRHPRLVLLGDYNIAPEDRDVHDPVAWAGQIHCTPQEREHFQGLVGLGLVDAFRLFEQPPKSWSWWDYRHLAFRRNQGLRIDHILVGSALREAVTACVIDKLPRKNERPSDHAPVTVHLSLPDDGDRSTVALPD